MLLFERKIFRIISENKLLVKDERLIIGVSGGPDSIALLTILGSLKSTLNLQLIVAYVDHGLRPDESPLECEFVRAESEKCGAEFEHGFVDAKGFSRREKISVEDGARQLRYEYLKSLAKKHKAAKIAVAHNADDQAEEFLLRLIRGTGRRGLSGMDLIRDGWLIRPLLGETKDDILAYLLSKKISFCQDSSNNDRGYLRNRVRLDLLPYISDQFHPGIKNVLRQTAAILKDEEHLLEAIAMSAYGKIVKDGIILELSLPAFAKENIAIQRRVIEKLLIGLSGQASFRHIEQIVHLATHAGDGRQIHLANGLRGIVKGETFCFSYPLGRTKERGNLVDDDSATFEVDIPGLGVFSLSDERYVEIKRIKKVGDLDDLDRGGDFFDAAILKFPLKCRNRLPGDKFHPLGGPGAKKIGNFLGDLKIPQDQRQQVVILETGKKIAGLLSLRIDHHFRVTPTTREVIRVTLHSEFPPVKNKESIP